MEATLLAYVVAERTVTQGWKSGKQSDYCAEKGDHHKEMLKMKVDPTMSMKTQGTRQFVTPNLR